MARLSREDSYRSWIVLLLLVTLLGAALPSVQGAGWLMEHADVARSGRTPDPGPSRFDIAYAVALPYEIHYTSEIVVMGDAVYSTHASFDMPTRSGQEGVWRTDLNTLESTLFVNLTEHAGYASGLASDGERLFVATRFDVRAYNASTGQPSWPEPAPIPAPPGVETIGFHCDSSAVHAGTVYQLCTAVQESPAGATDEILTGGFAALTVLALDVETGAREWSWAYNPNGANATHPLPDFGLTAAYGYHLVLEGDTAYVLSTEYTNRVDSCSGLPLESGRGDRHFPYNLLLHAVEAGTGRHLWTTLLDDETVGTYAGSADDWFERNLPPAFFMNAYGHVTAMGPDRIAAILRGTYMEFDSETGCKVKTKILYPPTSGVAPPALRHYGSDFMLPLESEIVAATHFGLARMSVDEWGTRWWLPTDEPPCRTWLGEGYGGTGQNPFAGWANGLVLASTSVVSIESGVCQTLRVMDLADGSVEWQLDMCDLFASCADNQVSFAVADGRIVALVRDQLLVVGHTEASIQLEVLTSSLHVAANQGVALYVGDTRPGKLDNHTFFSVDWGDVSTDPWTDQTFFQHRYAENGTYSVVVRAKNEAKQTASIALEVVVGPPPADDPVSLALQTPLSPSDAASASHPLAAMGPALGWAFGGVVLLGAFALVGVRRRRAPTGEQAYRNILSARVADGREGQDDAALRATRKELGISDRLHATIEAEVLTAFRRGPMGQLRDGGTVLGRYKVAGLLGEGGAGKAYAADDETLGRPVVIKVVSGGSSRAKRVLREARAMARVNHPNVVSVYDVERIGDEVWIVMERMAGGSLKEKLAGAPAGPDAFRELACDLLDGLAAVHEHGLVHHDIKPSNILLNAEGRAKIADFGITGDAVELTATVAASPPGTPAYLSPEKARGQAADAQSDLFSAGLVLYEAWTGQPYFERTNGPAFELVMRIAVAEPFREPIQGGEALRSWFARMLAPNPQDRVESAVKAREALVRVLTPKPTRRGRRTTATTSA